MLNNNKKGIILLSFALSFAFISLFFIFFSLTYIIDSIFLFYDYHIKGAYVDGYQLLYFVSYLSCSLSVCFSLCILPFDIYLMKKMNIHTWYTKTLFIIAIVGICFSLLAMFSLPMLYALS